MLNPVSKFEQAVLRLLSRVEQTISADSVQGVDVVLVGDVAAHFYTGQRLPSDLAFISDWKILLPSDLRVIYERDGLMNELSLDTNFFSSIALLHPDAIEDALFYEQLGRFSVKVLSPTDLAVSKIGRLEGNDLHDIKELAKVGLLDEKSVRIRTEEALQYYIGDTALKKYNLRDALEAIREINGPSEKDEPSGGKHKP